MPNDFSPYPAFVRFLYGCVVTLLLIVAILFAVAFGCDGWPRPGDVPTILVVGYPLWFLIIIGGLVVAIGSVSVRHSNRVDRIALAIAMLVPAAVFALLSTFLANGRPCLGFNS